MYNLTDIKRLAAPPEQAYERRTRFEFEFTLAGARRRNVSAILLLLLSLIKLNRNSQLSFQAALCAHGFFPLHLDLVGLDLDY